MAPVRVHSTKRLRTLATDKQSPVWPPAPTYAHGQPTTLMLQKPTTADIFEFFVVQYAGQGLKLGIIYGALVGLLLYIIGAFFGALCGGAAGVVLGLLDGLFVAAAATDRYRHGGTSTSFGKAVCWQVPVITAAIPTLIELAVLKGAPSELVTCAMLMVPNVVAGIASRQASKQLLKTFAERYA